MAFAQKTEAMFAEVQAQQIGIVREWMIAITFQLLAKTPGPGNQSPPDTLYDATGRLRAAWSFSLQEPPTEATRFKGGPYDESDGGVATASGIADEVRSMPLVSTAYFWNDVAYGYIIHQGLGRHHGARPWVDQVASGAYGLVDEATATVMSR